MTALAASRLVIPYQTALGLAGQLANASLYTYASGGTTPLATYSDAALSVPNTNPVIADASGTFGNVFLQNLAYRMVLKDANGAQIWTADPVQISPNYNGNRFSRTATKIAAYTVVDGDGEVPCDTSAGGFMVTVPFALGSATVPYRVLVYKKTSDANQVQLSGDGITTYAYLYNGNNGSGGGYLFVEVDGTAMQVFGVP